MANPAQVSDLIARGWSGDETVAQAWLDVAWRALCRECPDIEARLLSGDLDAADVVDVIVAATLRVLRNPGGFTQASGGIDDYNESYQIADATQDVYFTGKELARLCGGGITYADYAWTGSIKYT